MSGKNFVASMFFLVNISSGLDIEQRIRVLFSACSCFDLQQNWALNAYSRSALCRSFYDIKRCKSWYTQDIIFFWQEVAQMNIQIMILLVPTLVKHLVFYVRKNSKNACNWNITCNCYKIRIFHFRTFYIWIDLFASYSISVTYSSY